MSNSFDIAVIGAGHAGCEAALCAARMGARTCLITPDCQAGGRMSCNPAVGGIGKSHLVVELDALGGEIGRNADYTGIQFRTLNLSKGPAVRAARVQCDRKAYASRMSAVIASQANLTTIEGLATDILQNNGGVCGVKLADGRRIGAERIIVTAGTFLGGRIHIADEIVPGGRIGEDPADSLSESLRKCGLTTVRLKTGTPARIKASSIDFSKTERQPGDTPPPFLSLAARAEWEMFHVEQSGHVGAPGESEIRPWSLDTPQMPCYVTHTTEKAHELVRANLGRSAMYAGAITGTGVRYCPSFEDKIVKFADKTSHHVFLEPEGRRDDLVYPNGISNSLPREIQDEFLRAIPGLEDCVVTDWAYAIEYDAIDPMQLDHGLECKAVPGLFMAGQVNGTTGYEEAAAQGFVAAANAVLDLRGEAPLRIRRHEAYIGVMIDDLVTKGTDEPYRMFTSRAEYRLLLRPTNALARLSDHADRLGLLTDDYLELRSSFVTDVAAMAAYLEGRGAGGRLLKHDVAEGQSIADLPDAPEISPWATSEAEASALYGGYLPRELERVGRLLESEDIRIPADFDYSTMKSLSTESKQKLTAVRPADIGQAQRIPGVKPTDIAALLIAMKASKS